MTPRNTTRRSKARRLASAAAVVAVLDGSPVMGQEPAPAEVWAEYKGLDPRGLFVFKMDGQPHTKFIGLLRWDVPQDRLTAGGLDRVFTGYCAEPLVGVTAGKTYRYEMLAPENPKGPGLPDTEEARAETKTRATYIRELFGRHYQASLDPQNPDNARAFQVAVWEIVSEKEYPKAGDPAAQPFSLSTGTFQSAYPDPASTPAFVTTAQAYLASLTGDDSVFYTSESLAGRELVRMNGLPNAEGVSGQDQFAIRTQSAGAAGSGSLAGAPGVAGGGLGGTGSGIGGSGFGTPVGGAGGGVGGFGGIGGIGSGAGGFASSPPSSSISSPPTTPPTATSPGTGFSPPPINSPPPPPGGQSPPPGSPPPPPGPPPFSPPNAVPAPPGLLLGGIAALALAGRRALSRGKK